MRWFEKWLSGQAQRVVISSTSLTGCQWLVVCSGGEYWVQPFSGGWCGWIERMLHRILLMHMNTWRKTVMKKETDFFQQCPVTEPEAMDTDTHRRLSTKKHFFFFFTVRMAKHLQRLFRRLWDTQSVSGHSLVQWRRLDQVSSGGPFQSHSSCYSVINFTDLIWEEKKRGKRKAFVEQYFSVPL